MRGHIIATLLASFVFLASGYAAPKKGAPMRTSNVTLTFESNNSFIGGVTLPDVTLIEIFQQDDVKFSGTSHSFDLARSEDARYSSVPNLQITTGGKVLKAFGNRLSIQNEIAPVEMVIPYFPGNFKEKITTDWRGINLFRWNFADVVAWHTTKESVLYDVDKQLYQKDVRHISSAEMSNSHWIIRYTGVTPAILDAVSKKESPRKNDQLNEFSIDIYLPQEGAGVEILKAEGRNIFPELWKEWKVPITWKCPRLKEGLGSIKKRKK